MSWIVDSTLSWVQRLCVNIIKTGPVPKHVAVIMDGNRRYAKEVNVKTFEGHTKGFNKLAEMLQWCQDLGIPELTVYAFSIENFKRSKEEVDMLMQLAKEKFEKLLEEKDQLMAHGVCIRAVGNLSLLSEDLRKLIAEVMILTKNNQKSCLNIAMAYTSSDEITNAIKTIVESVEKGKLEENDINEQLISNCLYTNKSPEPDLLVRTSGEVRLSDFLLWQTSTTQMRFVEPLWPQFSIWHLLAAIFNYQREYDNIKLVKETKALLEGTYSKSIHNPRVANYLEYLNQVREKQLECYLQA